MSYMIKKGATSNIILVFIQDSSQTNGAGLTGLTSGSSGLVCYRARADDGNAGATQITLSGGTRGTWSSGGFVEKDSTNMPGWYELGLPNTAVATGSNYCGIELKGATNMAPCPNLVQLTDFDPQDSVHLGLTCLPNVASGSAGAIPTTGTGANQINVDGAGNASANLVKISGSAVSTSSAQLGVNAVNIAGQAATLDANNLLKVGVEAIDGNTSAPTNIKNAMASVAHGTCTTGASSTSIPTSAFTGPGVGAINQFVGRTMIFDSGTTTTALQGQATAITASTNSATPTFTVTALTTAPSSGDTFSIV